MKTDELHPEGTRAYIARLEAEAAAMMCAIAEAFGAVEMNRPFAAKAALETVFPFKRDSCGAALLADLAESQATRDRMRAILVGVADALKGEPAAGVQHDWSDLAEVATRLVTAGRNMAVCLDRFREEHDICDGDGKPHDCACARCQKAEKYSSDFRALLPQPQAPRFCPECGGSGRISQDIQCDACRGEGELPQPQAAKEPSNG